MSGRWSTRVEHDGEVASRVEGLQLGQAVVQRELLSRGVGNRREEFSTSQGKVAPDVLVGGMLRRLERHDQVVAVVAAEQVRQTSAL